MPEPHLRAPEPHLRASDRDRAAVAAALGEHMAAGRLTLAEYEERLGRVYETKTLGGLATLTTDLPSLASQAPAPAPERRPAPPRAHACGPWGASGSSWEAWRRTAAIVLTVWVVTSLAAGTFLYFWPVWVLGPWGAVLLAQSTDGRRSRDRRRVRT